MCCDSSWLCLQLAGKVTGHSDPWEERPVPLGQCVEVSSCRCSSVICSVCALPAGAPRGLPPCQELSDTAEPKLQHLGEWGQAAGQPGSLLGELVMPVNRNDCAALCGEGPEGKFPLLYSPGAQAAPWTHSFLQHSCFMLFDAREPDVTGSVDMDKKQYCWDFLVNTMVFLSWGM